MKNAQTQAFTLVELLITLTILALISVVAYTSLGVRQNNALNSKVTSEVETLTNALLLYKQEKSELPLPKWNLNFFAEDTSYVHDYENTQTFAVHGFITHDTLAKKYIDVLPIDPRTGSFYAYGKTKWTDSLDEMYEIAGVIWKNDSAISYVTWDYSAETGPYNLIRSYNGPEFVWDKSETNFPYNPQERILTAKIDTYSWSITINGYIYNESKVLDYELRTWDTIEIAQNWVVELYFSDGSRSVLWDTIQNTKLTLQKMEYKQENNLVTDIKLILESGMIWNKAASLDDQSEFEIYTVDSTAAVRWTVFWIQKNINASQIVVMQGSVAVKKNNIVNPGELTSLNLLKQAIDTGNDTLLESLPVSESTPGITINNGESVIVVNEGEPEVWVEFALTAISGNNTDLINDIPTYIIDEIINNTPKLNTNINIKLRKYSYSSGSLNITLDIQKKVFDQSNVIVINDDYLINKDEWLYQSRSEITADIMTVTLTWDTPIYKRNESTIDNTTDYYFNMMEYTHNTKDLEIRLGTYNIDKLLQLTWSVKVVLIENKGYINIDDQDITTQDEIESFKKEQEVSINNRSWICDGFKFTNINNESVCADADDTLKKDNWNLVAYAPYDNAGDLNMYSSSGKSINDYYGPGANNITQIDCNWNPSSQCDKDAIYFWADSYNNVNSLVWYSSWVKWIFIDNTNYEDKLKYDIEDLWLANLEKFVIEFSVRWEALKRESGTYYLLKNDNIKLYMTDWKLRLKFDGKYPEINSTDIKSVVTGDNNFYKIFLIQDNDKLKVTFWDHTISIDSNSIDLWQYQYIYNNNKQWNDVINYIKIYKKESTS